MPMPMVMFPPLLLLHCQVNQLLLHNLQHHFSILRSPILIPQLVKLIPRNIRPQILIVRVISSPVIWLLLNNRPLAIKRHIRHNRHRLHNRHKQLWLHNKPLHNKPLPNRHKYPQNNRPWHNKPLLLLHHCSILRSPILIPQLVKLIPRNIRPQILIVRVISSPVIWLLLNNRPLAIKRHIRQHKVNKVNKHKQSRPHNRLLHNRLPQFKHR